MKKLFLLLTLWMLGMAAFAQPLPVQQNGVTYKLYGYTDPDKIGTEFYYTTTYIVESVNKDIVGDIVIPDEVNSFPVTGISKGAFAGCTGITSVTLPNTPIPSVVSRYGGFRIELNAFSGCTALTNITIPETVTEIGRGAFHNCIALTSISLPNSLKKIEGWYDSHDGYTYEIAGSFENCIGLTTITIPSVNSIGNFTFKGCTGLTSVTIPSSVTTIAEDAFNGCNKLTNFEIVESGEVNYFFEDGILYDKRDTSLFKYSRVKIEEYTISDIVKSIGNYAFESHSNLKNLTIPGTVINIGDYTFSGCSGLKIIKCEGVEPPTCGSNVFGEEGSLEEARIYTNCSLIVPKGSEKIYSKMKPWNNFDIVKSDAITNVETASEAILAVGTQVSEVAAASNTTEENILNSTLHEIIELLQQLVETKKINLSEDGQNTLRALAALVENKTAIPTVENSFYVSVVEKTIVCLAESFQIYNLQGQNVTAQNGNLPAGVYVVVSKLGSQKVVVE